MSGEVPYRNMSVKKVDTEEYMEMLKSLMQEGHEVTMVVTGNSMVPFLTHGRDRVSMRKLDQKPKRGDIVFYQRENGQYVMHRILRHKEGQYTLIGDAQTKAEPGISQEQMFARITKAQVRGKWIGPGDFAWEFFEHIWLRIVPVRRILIQIYSQIHRYIKRN